MGNKLKSWRLHTRIDLIFLQKGKQITSLPRIDSLNQPAQRQIKHADIQVILLPRKKGSAPRQKLDQANHAQNERYIFFRIIKGKSIKAYLPPFSSVSSVLHLSNFHSFFFLLSPFYTLLNIRCLKFFFSGGLSETFYRTHFVLSHEKRGIASPHTSFTINQFSLHCRRPMQLCTLRR